MSTISNLEDYLDIVDTKIASISDLNKLEYLLSLKANLVLALKQITGGEGGGGDASDATLQSIRDRLMPEATLVHYLGTASSGNLKSSAGNVLAFTCSNTNSAIRWFQLHNKASNVATNDVPLISFPVSPDDSLLVIGQDVLGGKGLIFTTGISWGFSSTRLIFTGATASDCIASVRYL